LNIISSLSKRSLDIIETSSIAKFHISLIRFLQDGFFEFLILFAIASAGSVQSQSPQNE